MNNLPDFGYRHYIPILKGKLGDLGALRYLGMDSRALVTPLIEPTPPSESTTVNDRILTTIRGLARAWRDGTFFSDLRWLASIPVEPDDSHPVRIFAQQARVNFLRSIPVTSIDRDPAYQEATRSVVNADDAGMALRLGPDHFELPNMTVLIARLLNFLSLTPSKVDLVLDFGSVSTIGSGMLAQVLRGLISTVPHLDEWRTFTVAGSSFPSSLSELPRDAWTRLDRTEWKAWRSVVTGPSRPHRLPSYGDYTIGDPGLPFTGHGNFSASLRYSVDGEFFVWKGHPINSHPKGGDQIFDICADLVGRPEFAGESFSRGDQEIQARATNQDSPGNVGQWREWGTSHYIELVASQIASLPEP